MVTWEPTSKLWIQSLGTWKPTSNSRSGVWVPGSQTFKTPEFCYQTEPIFCDFGKSKTAQHPLKGESLWNGLQSRMRDDRSQVYLPNWNHSAIYYALCHKISITVNYLLQIYVNIYIISRNPLKYKNVQGWHPYIKVCWGPFILSLGLPLYRTRTEFSMPRTVIPDMSTYLASQRVRVTTHEIVKVYYGFNGKTCYIFCSVSGHLIFCEVSTYSIMYFFPM